MTCHITTTRQEDLPYKYSHNDGKGIFFLISNPKHLFALSLLYLYIDYPPLLNILRLSIYSSDWSLSLHHLFFLIFDTSHIFFWILERYSRIKQIPPPLKKRGRKKNDWKSNLRQSLHEKLKQ